MILLCCSLPFFVYFASLLRWVAIVMSATLAETTLSHSHGVLMIYIELSGQGMACELGVLKLSNALRSMA
jgi:hypothetical protein